MKPIRALLTELVDRRLWPIAALLAVAIIAVPVLLRPGGDSGSSDSSAGTTGAAALSANAPTAGLTDADVVATTGSGRGLRRGKAENPFVYRGPRAKAKSGDGKDATGAAGAGGSAASGSGSSGSSTTSGASSPAASQPKSTSPGYQTASIRVRFGRVENDRGLRRISRLDPLPSADNPVLVYLGVAKGTSTGVFLISSDAHAEGDGRCKPSAASCQTVWVKPGQTEFFDVTTDSGTIAQYQLDVVDVTFSRTSSKSKAAASFLKTTKANDPKAQKLVTPETATGPSGRLPVLSDLEWSGDLGRVLGIPADTTQDPLVVPAGTSVTLH